MKKFILPALGFVTGLVAGAFLLYCLQILQSREGAPGGEVLVLPLFALLVGFGVALGRMSVVSPRAGAVWIDGYHYGLREGKTAPHPQERHHGRAHAQGAIRNGGKPLFLDADWKSITPGR